MSRRSNNLGLALAAAGRLEEAAESFRRLLVLNPNHPVAHAYLGNVCVDLGRMEEAVASYRRALQRQPDDAETLNNLGNALSELGRKDEAITAYRQALEINPRYFQACHNLGLAHLEQRNGAEAIASFRRAPSFSRTIWMSCAISVGRGGSRVTSPRRSSVIERPSSANRTSPRPASISRSFTCCSVSSVRAGRNTRGSGAARDHRCVRVRRLRGMGPTWAVAPCFCTPSRASATSFLPAFRRPAPATRRRTHRLPTVAQDRVVACARFRLRPTGRTRTSPVGRRLRALGRRPSATARPCARGSNPPPLALTPLPARLEAMRARLAALGPAPHLGVTWRAGIKGQDLGIFKESPLAPLAKALAPLPDTVLVLQRSPQPGEIDQFASALGRPVHDLSALNDDLESMLALLALIDEYVGVSNTNMHLRAAVGRTARVLVPAPPEWRWMAEGKESPWFPGFGCIGRGIIRLGMRHLLNCGRIFAVYLEKSDNETQSRQSQRTLQGFA